MSKELSVSVAIAAYNGEKYIREQIDSILIQLSDKDELIVSYNESTDCTLDILKEYAERDPRFKWYLCSEKGVINNFNNAIKKTTGDIIFLADQDDVWMENKVGIVLKEFRNPNVMAVLHNCDSYSEDLSSKGEDSFSRGIRNGTLYNIFRNGYQGSCMAFRGELKRIILPIPNNIAMHDQWIGIIANQQGKVSIIDDKLIMYRRHDGVSSSNGVGMRLKIKYIVAITLELLKRNR